jgi:N-acetylmuramoyl-L-alanine amidase
VLTPGDHSVSATAVAARNPAPPPSNSRPIVWVQAGHEPAGEPGYRAQTGAGTGPFGSEVGFTTRVAAKVVTRLRAAGVDARRTPALVTPWGAKGAVFISIHHDAAGGHAAIGHAITGANENWYRGEGEGTAQPRPYPDSAPHRRATTVSRAVENRSHSLATTLATRFRAVFTRDNGARGDFTGVEPRDGNVRMMRFYGYYRSNASSRVLIECGAPGADDVFLSRTDTVSTAITAGIADHLRARGLLSG